MAEREFIRVKIEERVALLTIDRPPVNALNFQTMQELSETFNELADKGEVKVIVLTGEGKNHTFIAGADLKEMAQLKSSKEAEEIARKGQSVFNQIERMKKPVIAAVNSVCVGMAWLKESNIPETDSLAAFFSHPVKNNPIISTIKVI